MIKREILRAQWMEFFQTFTSDYAGRLVNFGNDGIEDRHTHHEIGDIESRELPLRDLAADLKDGENTLVISLVLSSDQVLRHTIQCVSHVWVTQTENGAVVALGIQSKNGHMMRLNISDIRLGVAKG